MILDQVDSGYFLRFLVRNVHHTSSDMVCIRNSFAHACTGVIKSALHMMDSSLITHNTHFVQV